MDKEMEGMIKSQLSLREKKKIGDWSKVEEAHDNIWGDATELRGNVTGIRGDVSGIRGDVTRIRGDVAGIEGNVSEIVAILQSKE